MLIGCGEDVERMLIEVDFAQQSTSQQVVSGQNVGRMLNVYNVILIEVCIIFKLCQTQGYSNIQKRLFRGHLCLGEFRSLIV